MLNIKRNHSYTKYLTLRKGKVLKVSVVLLLAGCVAEPTICGPSYELPFTDSSTMCSSSEVCKTGDSKEYARHLCFCGTLCICFHSTFKLSGTCKYTEDLDCKRDNKVMLFGGDFCSYSKTNREDMMNQRRIE